MSPNEFDLRQALRDGEDDAHLDVDGVLAGARARQAQRRMRALSAAAAVVVMAGAGAAGAAIWGGGDDHRPTAAAGASTTASSPARVTNPSAADGHASVRAGAGAAAAPTVGHACPFPYPQVALPGGGSPGQFGSDGTMFVKPVATIVACGYGSGLTPDDGRITARVYTGSTATALAASIEHAAKTPPTVRCPDIVLASQNRLALVAIATDGSTERVVTTTLTVPSCNVRVTNGTAIRYAWQPPRGVEAALLALRPAAAPSGAAGTSAAPGSPAQPAPSTAAPHKSLLPIGPSEALNGSPAR